MGSKSVIIEYNGVQYHDITVVWPNSIHELKINLSEALTLEHVWSQNQEIESVECFIKQSFQGLTNTLFKNISNSNETITLRIKAQGIFQVNCSSNYFHDFANLRFKLIRGNHERRGHKKF